MLVKILNQEMKDPLDERIISNSPSVEESSAKGSPVGASSDESVWKCQVIYKLNIAIYFRNIFHNLYNSFRSVNNILKPNRV